MTNLLYMKAEIIMDCTAIGLYVLLIPCFYTITIIIYCTKLNATDELNKILDTNCIVYFSSRCGHQHGPWAELLSRT